MSDIVHEQTRICFPERTIVFPNTKQQSWSGYRKRYLILDK